MKIVFSKVTSNRKKEFQIVTDIFQDQDALFVWKKGVENPDHILKMISNAQKFAEIFPGQVLLPKPYRNGILYPYAEGISLEEYACTGHLKEAVQIYLSFLDSPEYQNIFEPDLAFERFFHLKCPSCSGVKTANFDFIFANIIKTSSQVLILDTEWIFDFAVPRDFIAYRAAVELCRTGCFSLPEILPMLKIELPISLLEQMNRCFYQYVHADQTIDCFTKEQHYIFSALEDAEIERNRLNLRIGELGNWGKSLNEQIALKDERIVAMEEVRKSQEEVIHRQEEVIHRQDVQIETLGNENRQIRSEIEQIKSSTTYRWSLKYFKVRDFFLPKGSKRRLLVKISFKALRHPIWFFRHLTFKNLKKFFKYSKSEGAERVLERVDIYQENNQDKTNELKLDLYPMEPRKQYPELVFPQTEDPLVSIIIPVYNQFSYTYGCLESILHNTGNISYEIIIGDDCSTDETVHIQKYVKNIQVHRNRENTRFLLNCKRAVSLARGKYLCFLNNDTNVQPKWLDSLLETIESSKKVGMVGSKLVYPNGRLQEAGGILWKDGSAWNFGNKMNPEASEYQYRKPTDYISGASILLSKKLWEEIGGFDERFCPAYCEDSDLAFAVRKKGFEVIYDPFSVVVHYEGISNGTDLKQGVKKYQVENSKKFSEKWKEILKNHYPNGEHPFIARERGYHRKYLLMIDHYVPQFDKDAGSRTVYNYLKMFVDLGYCVKFIGENFYRQEPYTSVLQKLGIEVLYGPYYASHWKEWLKINGSYFDMVFLNRPHITLEFLNEVNKFCPNALKIYYGHDLHYVRIEREYELKKDPSLLEEARQWKEKEFKIFNQVDLIYYPSLVEQQILLKENAGWNVKVLQPYCYEPMPYREYEPEQRNGILFVGGFRHSPNFDGIMWFIHSVFPKVLKEIPDMKLYIAGSYPPQELLDCQNENIIVRGFVSDEELLNLYQRVRLVVVPLRYGAGIKGKVIEAMAMNVPVITTSCGAEGISTDAIFIDDEMNHLVKYYRQWDELKKNSKREYEYIMEQYTTESARRKWLSDIDEQMRRKSS